MPASDDQDLPDRGFPVDRVVFGVGAVAVLAVVAWGASAEGSLDSASTRGPGWVLHNFGWLFVVAADVFLVLCVLLAFSRYGRIRLGADDDEPEFTSLAWVAMMFSAGMGIGLMFYPRTWLVVVWGVLMGAVAAVLLVAGGLEALQRATILVALPFVLVMLALCWALVKELRTDPAAAPSRLHSHPQGLAAAVRAAVGEALAGRD